MLNEAESPFDAYRAVNEQVRQFAAESGKGSDHDDLWEFVCECGDPGCFEHVRLRVSEFDAVVASGENVLVDGHVLVAAGQVRANARRLREEARALQAQARQAQRRATRRPG